MLKLLAGSFLAFLAVRHLVPLEKASEPTQMYLVAFHYVFASPHMALAFTGAFVIISQLKINVTNAYAGSIAWSNFFSRLTHSHPGRVVWLVFNVTIALLLMELGIFKALERILGFYSHRCRGLGRRAGRRSRHQQAAGAQPAVHRIQARASLRHQPGGRRRHAAGNHRGRPRTDRRCLARRLQPLAAFLALAVAFIAAPAIAYATGGAYYIAREPQRDWSGQTRDPLRDLRASFRARRHGAMPRLFRPDLLALLLA